MFFLRFFLVSRIYYSLKLFRYQNLGNAQLILKNYIKNTLFLTLILLSNSLQFFDIFDNNNLKLITLLHIVNVKNVK